MSLKALILDRDGTINVWANKESHGYVLSPDEMVLLPHVKEALELAHKKGLKIFIFTQQRCVNKKMLTTEELDAIHQKMQDDLGGDAPIEGIYYCPHLHEEDCDCSKPKPGMIRDILRDYHLTPADVLVLGDAKRDWEAAKAAGASFAFVKSEKHTEGEYASCAIPAYDNLLEAIKRIL